MKPLRAGIIGTGFIGVCHMDALRRIGIAEIGAVANPNKASAQKRAAEYRVEKCYDSIDAIIQDPEIDVIHNCTPNFLHNEVNRKAILAGKHVFSEKPLTRNLQEAQEIFALSQAHPQIVTGVNHCYRMNPLVKEMRAQVQAGAIGQVRLVHGSYLQDHMLYDTDYNWRLEPELNGDSRAMADIGTHWMDTIQTIIGAKITSVCADLVITLPKRKKPKVRRETFSVSVSAESEEIAVETEDFGSVLFQMDNGVHGVFYVSQVSAGRSNQLSFEIDGSQGAYAWNQENPNEVWGGYRDRPCLCVTRDPGQLSPYARAFTHLAKGHPEGWNDAMRNNVAAFYQFILEGKQTGKDPCEFATFAEAYYQMRLVDAILRSSKSRAWVQV